MQKLRTGAAYHGCRMLNHVEADMRDMADHHMNTVVHMFSHTDWDRHCRVMRDIVGISEEAGLEVWMDNWGLGGPPGDKSHFLAYHPEAHQILSEHNYHGKKRRNTVDAVAASLILEGYLAYLQAHKE